MTSIPTSLWKAILKKCMVTLVSILATALPPLTDAHAYDCFEKSPSYANGQSPFENMVVRDLSRVEQDYLERLFESLTGRWQGEAADVECKGRMDSPSVKRTEYTAAVKIKRDRKGNIRIEMELESDKRNTTHEEVTTFYLIDEKLRSETDGAAGDVQLIEVSRNEVSFLKRGVMSGGWWGGNTKREIYYTLSDGPNAFSIDIRYYVQGNFTFRKIRYFYK